MIYTIKGRRQWHPSPVLLPGKSHGWRSLVGYSPWVAKSRTRLSNFTLTFHFHALDKEMATRSSVLALRIPGTVEPGGLPSMGSHRVGHDWSDLAAATPAAAVCLYSSQTPNLSLPTLFPFSYHKFVFYVCGSISVLYISSFVSFFLDSTYKWYHMAFEFLFMPYLT